MLYIHYFFIKRKKLFGRLNTSKISSGNYYAKFITSSATNVHCCIFIKIILNVKIAINLNIVRSLVWNNVNYLRNSCQGFWHTNSRESILVATMSRLNKSNEK